MTNFSDENAGEDWNKTPNESRSVNRIGQIIQRVLVQGVEAQKSAARTAEKNARYMLWTVALAAVSTLISAAGVVFAVVYLLRSAPAP